MVVLGFNCYVFDSAACLIVDGQVVAAVQEERFTRNKGTGEFPEQAILYCLKAAGLTIADVDHVGFYWDPLLGLPQRVLQILKGLPSSLRFWGSHSGKWWSMYQAQHELVERMQKHFPNQKPRFQFHNVRHHLAHAASSFLCSPFEEAAFMVMDGAGEIHSTSLGYGKDRELHFIEQVSFPHSLGYLYVSLTHYLGFKPDSDEYKVMALASMGQESDHYKAFQNIVKLSSRGRYVFDLSYFNYHLGGRDPWVSAKFIKEFGALRRKDEPLEERHCDIAWALQARLQDVAKNAAQYLYEKTGSKNLVISGGCGLNCVMNEDLRENTPFETVWLPSVPNDAGTSMGAALWVQHHVLKQPRSFRFESAALGPEFTDSDLEVAIEANGFEAQKLSEADLLEASANLLAQGKIIGWCQGRAEFGPRALGYRSILAHPGLSNMKQEVNRRIKHREGFRPFAPAVLEEKANQYFYNARSLPFMVFVLKARAEKISEIPAVVHTDGTARVQTVNPQQNRRFYGLIKKFEEKTGLPMLLNTSFNDAGEPIVNSPEDMLSSARRTDLDAVVMGSFLVSLKSERD